MSLVDDRTAEIDAQFDRAWQKHRYGKKYSPAYEVALRIKTIRTILSAKGQDPGDQLILSLDKIKTVLSNMFDRGEVDPEDMVHILFSLHTAWILLVGVTASRPTIERCVTSFNYPEATRID
jgi:hypothetical protein